MMMMMNIKINAKMMMNKIIIKEMTHKIIFYIIMVMMIKIIFNVMMVMMKKISSRT